MNYHVQTKVDGEWFDSYTSITDRTEAIAAAQMVKLYYQDLLAVRVIDANEAPVYHDLKLGRTG